MTVTTDALERFRDCPVLVVGDLMLDEFVWGRVSRISPEAPVPVVEVTRRSFVPGGAANTAANIGALGGIATVAGVVGQDSAGERVAELLRAGGVRTGPILRDPAAATTTKTRVIAHSQQVVRIDTEPAGDLGDEAATRLLDAIRAELPAARGCVVSDYGKGVVTRAFAERLIAMCRAAGVPVVVDPKGTDYGKYRGATVVKPNQLEAGRALNRELRTGGDVERAGVDLAPILGEDTAALITRGAHGMTLFEPGQAPLHLPAQAREVYDVTGAGDTVAGVLALALASGLDLPGACRLAGLAAAIVVGKVGTATCSLEELQAARQVAKWG